METDMTREEAIKVVKERLNYYESEKRLRAACELLIPELSESEDEKNANALIRLLNDEKVSLLMTYEAKHQWLDWLERKKTPSVSFEPAAGFDCGSAVVYHNDESEDERIRKELVAFFKEVRGEYWHDLLVADILAYLVKQKEQPEVDLENYISNKLRELGADLINHKPYSFNRGLNVGKTNAYHDILDKINARKEENK